MKVLFAIFEILTSLYPFYFFSFCLGFFYFFRKSYPDFRPLFSTLPRVYYFWLAFYFLAGLFFRVKYSHHIDFDFYGWAYIKDALAVKDFLGFNFTSEYKLSHSLHVAGYPCLLVPGLILFKSLISVSIINGIFSLLTFFLIFFLAYLFSRNNFIALLSAGIYAFSPLHIVLSAKEIPVSASVFFVSLTFLFILLWLHSKNRNSGWAAVFAFVIAINIKFENMVFLPIVVIGLKGMFQENQLFPTLKRVGLITVISTVFITPFVFNMIVDQFWIFKNSSVLIPSFSFTGFTRHFYYFFIAMFFGAPLLVIIGYLLMRLAKKKLAYDFIIFGWIGCAMIFFFWYADIFSYWSMAITLVPIYVLAAFILAWPLEILFKRNRFKLFSGLFMVLLAGWCFGEDMPSAGMSWLDIKKEFKTENPKACVVAPDSRLKISLLFLFPDQQWLFLDDPSLRGKIGKCKEGLYYFNPIPYGLREEWGAEDFLLKEEAFSREYLFQKVGDIFLYKIVKKTPLL